MTSSVVLLHGIGRTSASMRPLQRALVADGYAVLNLDYRSRHMALEELAESIHAPVSRFAAAAEGEIHVVGHSMGGLLARVYLSRHRPARLGRVVMAGTPNGGSEVADLLCEWYPYRLAFGPAGRQLTTTRSLAFATALGQVDFPLGIVAGDRPSVPRIAGLVLPGPNDGKVTVSSTRVDGMADHVTIPTSHTRLIAHPAAIAATLTFLREGHFGRRNPIA